MCGTRGMIWINPRAIQSGENQRSAAACRPPLPQSFGGESAPSGAGEGAARHVVVSGKVAACKGANAPHETMPSPGTVAPPLQAASPPLRSRLVLDAAKSKRVDFPRACFACHFVGKTARIPRAARCLLHCSKRGMTRPFMRLDCYRVSSCLSLPEHSSIRGFLCQGSMGGAPFWSAWLSGFWHCMRIGRVARI
jgi:hypothetical protein